MLTAHCLQLWHHPFLLRLAQGVTCAPFWVPPQCSLSAWRCRKPGQQDSCLLPNKGCSQAGATKAGSPSWPCRGWLEEGDREEPTTAQMLHSLAQLGCSICPTQHFPFGSSNHCSVGASREEPLLRSLCYTKGQEVGTGRSYG